MSSFTVFINVDVVGVLDRYRECQLKQALQRREQKKQKALVDLVELFGQSIN
jgi:hypothetical protein